MLRRSAIFLHRWLGVALCGFFLLWFASGIGMMYWDFPSVTAADRLDRSPALDAATIHVSLADAQAAAGQSQEPSHVRLNTFDGRPVYRFLAGRDEALVYADTGARQVDTSAALLARVASVWVRQPVRAAAVDRLDAPDQWTVQGTFRSLRPLWKYSWPDGEQVYVSQSSGEVVQYTTTAARVGAYLGPIPHWLYFTPLRSHQLAWSRVVIWSSGTGTVAALLGIVVGVWTYSPSKRYRIGGAASSIPYRGWKRWHAVLGLIVGLAAVTWAFSGMLSMDPFPAFAAGESTDIQQALRPRPQMSAFAARDPRDALAQLPDLQVKELELMSCAGEPVYLATLAGGATQIVPLGGPPRADCDRQRIADAVRQAVQPNAMVETRVLDRYDRYYLDRRRHRPLPVMLARVNDDGHTRYYIDPTTARVVGGYSSRSWVTRWLYHGLHSLDFPWLYDYRPAWDLVVITCMLGGTALCITSLILAWRVLARGLKPEG